MGNRVHYGGPQNSLSAHLCARRLLKKEDLKSRPKEKEKRRANEDESYFRRRQLLFCALLVYKATLHASGEIKLVNFLLSFHQNPLPVWAKKTPFPHVLRRIRNKVKRSSQSEISCINMTMTRRMYACIASKSFSRLDNFSVSPWVKKLKLGDNGQWTEPSKISSACVQVNSTLGAFSHAPVGPACS